MLVLALALTLAQAAPQQPPQPPPQDDFDLLPNVVSGSLSRQRLGMLLMLLFGMAGIALAAIGVYGVIAYAIAQRVREVAILLALGANARRGFQDDVRSCPSRRSRRWSGSGGSIRYCKGYFLMLESRQQSAVVDNFETNWTHPFQ